MSTIPQTILSDTKMHTSRLIANNAQSLGTNKCGFGCRHVVRESNNTTFWALLVTTSGNIEVYNSTDSGQTWTLSTTFTPGTGQTLGYPTICKAITTDHIFVSYTAKNSSLSWNVYVQKYNGSSWSEVTPSSWGPWTPYDSANDIVTSAITFNRGSTGRFHIFIAYRCSTSSFSYIINKYSDDEGSTWSSEGSTSATCSTTLCISDIDTKSDGTVVVCTTSNTAVKLTRFTANGVYSSNTSYSPNGNASGSMAIDSSNNERVVYYATNGVSWSIWYGATPTLVATIQEGHLALGIDGADNIYVIYTKSSDLKTYMCKYNIVGGSWDSARLISYDQGQRVKVEQHSPASASKLHYVFFSD
jgi:hypothetical protein